jgi:hypothetical protein
VCALWLSMAVLSSVNDELEELIFLEKNYRIYRGSFPTLERLSVLYPHRKVKESLWLWESLHSQDNPFRPFCWFLYVFLLGSDVISRDAS